MKKGQSTPMMSYPYAKYRRFWQNIGRAIRPGWRKKYYNNKAQIKGFETTCQWQKTFQMGEKK